jgi:alanine dehydrogenase
MRAGATIVDSAAEAWSMDMVMKVKEPIATEYSFFAKGSFYSLTCTWRPSQNLQQELIQKKVIGIAYEQYNYQTAHCLY